MTNITNAEPFIWILRARLAFIESKRDEYYAANGHPCLAHLPGSIRRLAIQAMGTKEALHLLERNDQAVAHTNNQYGERYEY